MTSPFHTIFMLKITKTPCNRKQLLYKKYTITILVFIIKLPTENLLLNLVDFYDFIGRHWRKQWRRQR